MNFPRMFRNLRDGAAAGLKLLLYHLSLMRLGARWPRPGRVMNPSGKRHGRGIRNGKLGWSTRMRFYDTVLMEVVLALR